MKRAREASTSSSQVQQRVMIDVGGTKFSTTVTTIQHSSYLAGMVDVWDESQQHAEIFLDRDPEVFAVLLRLMRQMPRVVGLIPQDAFIVALLIAEADFFGVDALLTHVKVKAYYNSRRVGQDMPEPSRTRRNEGESAADYRQRRQQAFQEHLKECRRVKKAFKKKDEKYAVQRFAQVYGSVSDALENDVLPKYFLEPKPIAAPPSKKIVQVLPVESTAWFLVGDIYDAKYISNEAIVDDDDLPNAQMKPMEEVLQQPGAVRRVAHYALIEDGLGHRKLEPMLHLSPADYELWLRRPTDVEDGPPTWASTEGCSRINSHTGGLESRTMLASEWLKRALFERRGHMGEIYSEHYWTHIAIADTAPTEHGFSRDLGMEGHVFDDEHVSTDDSDDE